MLSKTLVQVQKLMVGMHPDGYLTYNVYLRVEGDEEHTYVVGGFPDVVGHLTALFTCTGASNSDELLGKLLYAMVDLEAKKVYSFLMLFSTDGCTYPIEPVAEVIEEDQVCPMRTDEDQVSHLCTIRGE